MSDDFRAATPRVAAGVLFRDGGGRILLVKPTYKDGWDIPGGYVEPGESPLQAATREVAEELDLNVPIGRLLVVDWAPHPAEGDKLLFIFDGGELGGSDAEVVSADREEIGAVRFADSTELEELLPERLHDRVRSALTVGMDTYLEHGNPVSSA